jgi:hypothetical protein
MKWMGILGSTLTPLPSLIRIHFIIVKLKRISPIPVVYKMEKALKIPYLKLAIRPMPKKSWKGQNRSS